MFSSAGFFIYYRYPKLSWKNTCPKRLKRLSQLWSLLLHLSVLSISNSKRAPQQQRGCSCRGAVARLPGHFKQWQMGDYKFRPRDMESKSEWWYTGGAWGLGCWAWRATKYYSFSCRNVLSLLGVLQLAGAIICVCKYSIYRTLCKYLCNNKQCQWCHICSKKSM